MKLLLDTHVLLWAWRAPERLSKAARAAIADRGNDIFVSAISAFEIATKARIGKLPGVESNLLAWDANLGALHTTELKATARHSIVAGRLEWDHRDPFDRMLAAQSLIEQMTLVTSDHAFDTLGGVDLLWD